MEKDEVTQDDVVKFAEEVLPEVQELLARVRAAEERGMSSVPRPLAVGYVIGARAALELAKRYLDDAVGQP